MAKNSKIPRQAKSNIALSKSDKHTYSNCYSITIRTGCGINLGSNSTDSLIQAFTSHHPEILAYILVREKEGNEEHFQGGVFYKTHDKLQDNPRQDKIRDALLPYVIDMYKEQNPQYCTKQLQNVAKNALKVVPHTNFKHLYSYCTKAIDGDWSLIEKSLFGPFKSYELAPHLYCIHDYPFWTYNWETNGYSCQCKYGCYPP